LTIPDNQLIAWTAQGATTSAAQTHLAIRTALNSFTGWPKGIGIDVYLQGSYRNDTQIRVESDVDVVAELTSTVHVNTLRMSVPDQQAFSKNVSRTAAPYQWDAFRQDVARALVAYFGAEAIEYGSKAIRVKASGGRRKADVVVAATYDDYLAYSGPQSFRLIKGIWLKNASTGAELKSFPKIHYDNGVAKNDMFRARGDFKATVRLFKNLRSVMIDAKLLGPNEAPSYFIECLLYNVPDECYHGNYGQMVPNILNWLRKTTDKSLFVFQNEQFYLLRELPGHWAAASCERFIQGAIKVWNDWR
jgi:hypothetical protein